MKAWKVICGIVWCFIFAFTAVHAQEKEAKERKPYDMQAMEKAWAESMMPGEYHEHLAKMVGSWNYTGNLWTDPGAPPMETAGTSENEMILDGRFLRQIAKGDFKGSPFEGIGLTGYDNITEQYQFVWIDNMGTMMTTMTGTCDPKGKILTSYGESPDPITKKMQKFKSVTTIESDDELVHEWFIIMPNGKEMKTMELFYTRK